MTSTPKIGKRQALVPLDSPSQARCLGATCRKTSEACPGHEFRAYAALGAQHKAEDVAA